LANPYGSLPDQRPRANALTLHLGPPSGVNLGRLVGVGALWGGVPRVCGGGGGCAGGGVPLGAVPALSWCGEVSLGGKHHQLTWHCESRCSVQATR